MTYYLFTENAIGQRLYATDYHGRKIEASEATAEWWLAFNTDTGMVRYVTEEALT